LTDINGRILENVTLKNQVIGENTYQRKINSIDNGGVFFLTIETPGESATQKIIVQQ
jgi:hypothetical protein